MAKTKVPEPPFDVPASEVFGDNVKKENIVDSTLDWLTGNDTTTELPPPPKSNSGFRRALPEVRFGVTLVNKSKYAGFVCTDGEDAFLEAPTFDEKAVNGKRLRFIPIRTIRRHTIWRNGRPLYEDPANYGPAIGVIPDKEKDQVRDIIRIVYYDIDRKGIYQMDLSSQASRREAEMFDYFLRLQAKGDEESKPTPAFAHLYFAMTNAETSRTNKQTYYNLRLLRRGDVVSRGELTETVADVTTLPQYQRIDLTADREFAAHLDELKGLLSPGSKGAAAVKMATLNGLQANGLIKKVDESEVSLEDVLRVVPETYVSADGKPADAGLT